MSISNIRCPFCTEGYIKAESGENVCRACDAKFRIDDRVQYIFVDLNNPRIPIKGTYCRNCGLVQSHYRKRCRYCGTIVRPKLQ